MDVRGESDRPVANPRWATPALVVGVLLVVLGVAFHGVAAAHHPAGPGGGDTWETLLDHAASRWAAYGVVVGGVAMAVKGWNARRQL